MDRQSYINRDYKPEPAAETCVEPRISHWYWGLPLLSLLSAGVFFTLSVENQVDSVREDSFIHATPQAPTEAMPAAQGLSLGIRSLASFASPAEQSPGAAPLPHAAAMLAQTLTQTITVKKGDTLASIFSKLGLTPQQLADVLQIGKDTVALKRLLPGQQVSVQLDADKQLRALTYQIDKTSSLQIERAPTGYEVNRIVKEPQKRLAHAMGTISSSLFTAGLSAGLSSNLIMDLANIFAWDIDFGLDLRENDSFSVIYEEQIVDGEKIGNGAILAAEFTNQGRVYRAVRYADPSGNVAYYGPDGRSLRKTFLRSPMEFTRISSGFGERFHPILNRFRLHNGVDYAAATGTPIKATGDGRIVFRGTKGGYGNTLIIQHGQRYSTLYGHLSNYAKSVQIGSAIRQGQTIGYVGSTGLASGPHLHYEFRVDGAHRNPLTVKLPFAEPLPRRYRDDFNAKTYGLLAQLDLLKRGTLAQNTF